MSKKSVSGFVSSLGALLDFVIRLIAAFTKRGGNDEQFHELIAGKKSEDFINQVANLAMKMLGTAHDGLRIVVDYSRSLVEMIKAGKYDWVNDDITADHFPVKGSGKTELNPEIIHYGKCMSSDAIVQDLDQRGLRPATLAELLTFGEKYPDEQRKYPIVALGSVWRYWHGYRCVAYLYGDASKRSLNLNDWDGDWSAHDRFLVFRK